MIEYLKQKKYGDDKSYWFNPINVLCTSNKYDTQKGKSKI